MDRLSDRLEKANSQRFAQWDSNKDGRIGGDDIMRAYDADNSGSLDASEVTALASQLSSQLEFSNSLLRELKHLEESQINSAAQIKQQNDHLVQVMGTLKEKSNEVALLQREVQTKSGALDIAKAQLDKKSQECARKDEQLQSATTALTDMEGRLQEVEREKQGYLHQLSTIERRTQGKEDDYDKRMKELERRNEDLRSQNEVLSRDVEKLRSREHPLTLENAGLHRMNRELNLELSEIKDSKRETDKELDETEQRCRMLDGQTRAIREQLRALQVEKEEGAAKITALIKEGEEREEHIDELQQRIQSLEQRTVNISAEMKVTAEENSRLQTELETNTNELVQQAKQRSEEQQRWAHKQAEAQHDMKKMMDEIKQQAEEYASDAQRRAEEAVQARLASEEQYVILQHEHAELHKLVQQMQFQNQKQIAQFDDRVSKDEADRRQLSDHIVHLEQQREMAQKAHHRERQEADAAMLALRQDVAARGQQHVEILAAFKSAIGELTQRHQRCRDTIREIHAKYQTLVGLVSGMETRLAKPLQVWFDEVDAAFNSLVDYNKTKAEMVEELKDDLRSSELEKEEQVGKTLLLDERVSALEHDVSERDEALRALEARSRESLEGARRAREAVEGEKSELEKQVRKLRAQLDANTEHKLTLQNSASGLSIQLAETQARTSSRVEELQRELRDWQEKFNNAIQQKEELFHEKQSLGTDVSNAEKLNTELRAENEHQREKLEQQEARMNKMEADFQKALQVQKGSADQYRQQNEGLSQRYEQVLQRKDALEAEVARMQADLRQLAQQDLPSPQDAGGGPHA